MIAEECVFCGTATENKFMNFRSAYMGDPNGRLEAVCTGCLKGLQDLLESPRFAHEVKPDFVLIMEKAYDELKRRRV
jgi:hypothetical protein